MDLSTDQAADLMNAVRTLDAVKDGLAIDDTRNAGVVWARCDNAGRAMLEALIAMKVWGESPQASDALASAR